MVRVIEGDAHAFNAFVYGEKHPGTMQFLENQVNFIGEQLSNFSHNFTEAGRQFFQNTQQLYDQFNGSAAIRLAQAAVRKVKGIFQPNVIQSLWDIESVQTAPIVMQRYIMAEPTVRQMYHDQRVDGYSETYVDMHPNDIGERHYDFRRVQHGMVQEVEGDPEDWRVKFYIDELAEGDRELSLQEKLDITSVWDLVKGNLNEGSEDPTSPFGGKL